MKHAFVHFRKFDSSRCVRELPYDGLHCWAVKKDNLKAFLREYQDGKPVVIRPTNKTVVWALNYEDVEWYVLTPDDEDPPPERIPFDPALHCVVRQEQYNILLGKVFPYFENPYQVLVEI